MVLHVVGTQRKKGTFHSNRDNRDIAYDNVMLHTTRTDKLVSGTCTEVLKVKTSILADMGMDVSTSGFEEGLIGCDVDVAFDRYANVAVVQAL